jgi:oxygen-independent coproporphyrinogen-3 oxidase
LEAGRLPLARALAPTAHQMLVRELILRMKLGRLDIEHFRKKFGVDIAHRWRDVWQRYESEGFVQSTDRCITLSREGLLRADALLPAFFEPEFQGARYT